MNNKVRTYLIALLCAVAATIGSMLVSIYLYYDPSCVDGREFAPCLLKLVVVMFCILPLCFGAVCFFLALLLRNLGHARLWVAIMDVWEG